MPASMDGELWFGQRFVGLHTVHKNIKVTFLVLDLFDELLNLTLLGDVANDGDDLASDVLSVGLLNSLELLLSTANDVDLGSVDSKSLSGLQVCMSTLLYIVLLTAIITIRPIPEPPPVTRATLPLTSKTLLS